MLCGLTGQLPAPDYVGPQDDRGENVITRSDINRMTVIYVVAVALIGTAAWALIDPSGVQRIPNAKIDNAAEKALTVSTEIVKLLLSLSTGAMAACAWLMTRPRTEARSFTESLALVSASMLLLCASMYFGFVTLDGFLELLAWRVFDSRASLVWWPQTLQYYSFLAGIIVFGLAVIRSVNVVPDAE